MFGGRALLRRTAVTAAALLAVGGLSVPADAAPSGPQAPGTLLGAQPVTNLDPALVALGAREWRVWYTSRSGLNNRPVVVSGMVIEPAGTAPKGG